MSTPVAIPPWPRLYNDVKMVIPGLTDAVFKQMLYQVVNDFMDRTNIFTETVSISANPTTLVYPFTLAKFGMANRLMLLYDPSYPDPNPKWVQGGVQMNVPGVITLSYAPSTAVEWKAIIAKTLDTVSSDGYPDLHPDDNWIIDKYGDGIQFGILGRLQSMPAKPYSNAKGAKDNWQIYVTERGKARTDMLKANVFGGQRWVFPQSFATVHRKGWA